MLVTGKKVIREFLLSPYQKLGAIYLARDLSPEKRGDIPHLARERKVPLREVSREDLKALSSGKDVRGGILATLPRFVTWDLEDLLQGRSQGDIYAVALDRVFDPQNLGAVVRSAFCFGASFLVIQKVRAAGITESVIRASAGTVARIPVVQVTNLARALDRMKEDGYWVYGAESRGGEDPERMDFSGKVIIVLGSEGEGMREGVRKRCDFFLRIPMVEEADSLNVSVAAGILFYNVYKKKVGKRGPSISR
ncbi:MAG: 23S rRNA (guanosine(2251)-2'-O)-methyltransferase RlmB [Deltaproteobacteria bacterium]|nr:MAG: 23S rRNA (guanosine(2251)-2'-O)-methyltransferase RlmB [Deltaproteobacteria bacterium]